MQKRRPKLYLLVIFFFIIVLFFFWRRHRLLQQCPCNKCSYLQCNVQNQVGICDVCNSQGHFSMHRNPFLLSCPLQTISIICILQLSVHKMFCLQRHVECMFCLLLYYGYCCGVNDVQDQSMSREIQYTVITTSCVKASLTAD